MEDLSSGAALATLSSFETKFALKKFVAMAPHLTIVQKVEMRFDSNVPTSMYAILTVRKASGMTLWFAVNAIETVIAGGLEK